MLDEALYTQIRRRAAERGESMSHVVAEALATYLAAKPTHRTRVELTVAEGGGWIGPIDMTSNRALLDPLDRDALPGQLA